MSVGSEAEPVKKAEGVTDSEKYLASLCEKNFLSLWSYPGVYRDQGQPSRKGHGKEICDLLVVFDKHIILFSDKHCKVHNSGNQELDWQRWFRKAIQQSAEQIWGAERWIRQYPHRIFLDRECKRRLPVELPKIEDAMFHLVVVAHGISGRIKIRYPASNGSLILNNEIKGFEAHTEPFVIGDLAIGKTFVHVLDDDSLNTLMATRDTISDFVSYLTARERLLRGSKSILAPGEEQLLAAYLGNFDGDDHAFVFPADATRICLLEGIWEDFQRQPQRIAQLRADRVSYAWDSLIEKFSYYALEGTQYFAPDGGLKETEMIMRFMAREPRWKRRYLATTLLEMLNITPIDSRRLRVAPPAYTGDPHYVFLLFPKNQGRTEAEYRIRRRNFLQGCCIVTKLKYPKAEDIIGIATESGSDLSRSEDAIYLDARNWTPEQEAHAEELHIKLGILKNPKEIRQTLEEYPTVVVQSLGKNPRNKPCPCGSGKRYKHCCLP